MQKWQQFKNVYDIGKIVGNILTKFTNIANKCCNFFVLYRSVNCKNQEDKELFRKKHGTSRKIYFIDFFILFCFAGFFPGKSIKCHEKHGSLQQNCSLFIGMIFISKSGRHIKSKISYIIHCPLLHADLPQPVGIHDARARLRYLFSGFFLESCALIISRGLCETPV